MNWIYYISYIDIIIIYRYYILYILHYILYIIYINIKYFILYIIHVYYISYIIYYILYIIYFIFYILYFILYIIYYNMQPTHRYLQSIFGSRWVMYIWSTFSWEKRITSVWALVNIRNTTFELARCALFSDGFHIIVATLDLAGRVVRRGSRSDTLPISRAPGVSENNIRIRYDIVSTSIYSDVN